MKKLLLILIALPMIGFGQKTYVPCDAFEYSLDYLGYGDNVGGVISLNDSVYTDSIISITDLSLTGSYSLWDCNDLTGIEDFSDLQYLGISGGVKNIDLSNNYNLTQLNIDQNDSLTTLDISNLSNLSYLSITQNSLAVVQPMTSLDLSSNISLENLIIGCFQPFNSCVWNASNHSGLLGLTQLDLTNNVNLKYLQIHNTKITSFNGSNFPLLEHVTIANNSQLTSLNLSNNPILYSIICSFNLIDQIDISNNPILNNIDCSYNNIPCLDFSSLPSLQYFDCKDNLLEELVLTTPNWMNMYGDASSNLLTCVEVDNVLYANTHFTIDSFASFSTNCNYTNPCATISSIQEQTTNKDLLKITDFLGRETKGTKNQVLFYIYDDGTVEKRIVID